MILLERGTVNCGRTELIFQADRRSRKRRGQPAVAIRADLKMGTAKTVPISRPF
jgi:hypothetical protein